MTPYLTLPDTSVVELRQSEDGLPDAVHLFSKEEIAALNAALATGRPLLVRGEPGTGKTQLGRAAAAALGWGLAFQVFDGLTEVHDALWTLDPVARLAEAQVLGVARSAPQIPVDVAGRLDLRNFLSPGVLWWALDPRTAREQEDRRSRVGVSGVVSPCHLSPRGAPQYGAGVVAVVDEIDKADPSVPNALLDALGHKGFVVPGWGRVGLAPGRRPLVILTTNEERSLPDAFLRRCLVLCYAVPEKVEEFTRYLLERGERHFRGRPGVPDVERSVLEEAADLTAKDRDQIRKRQVHPPGLAEFLDLVRAVVEQRPGDAGAQRALLQEVRPYALWKHPGGLAP